MKALEQIGLTLSEEKVYLALLEKGDSTRTTIVKTSGIAGSKVYEVLDKLQKKGLVSTYLKNHIKHFKPLNPKQIYDYLNEQKGDIINAENEVAKIMPKLLAQFTSSKKDQEVELLTGIKGLRLIFNEQVESMKKGETCYVIGGLGGKEESPEIIALFKKIHQKREEKGIKTKMLYTESYRKIAEKEYSSKEYSLTTTQFIRHAAPVALNVYQDKTILLIAGNSTTAISITSQDVANSFLEYFNLLWKTAR